MAPVHVRTPALARCNGVLVSLELPLALHWPSARVPCRQRPPASVPSAPSAPESCDLARDDQLGCTRELHLDRLGRAPVQSTPGQT